MKSIWTISLWKTKWIMRDKSSWFTLFILPIVFALIFGGMQSDNSIDSTDYQAKVGIVTNNTEIASKLITDIIKHQLKADMINFSTDAEALSALKNGGVSAFVLLPDHFEKSWALLKKTPWQIIYDKQTGQNFMMEQQMKQLIIGLNAITMMETDYNLTPKEKVEIWLRTWQKYRDSSIGVEIQYGHMQHQSNASFSRVFIGFTLMFLMFALNQSAASILEEKEIGTWNRLLIAPLHKSQIILGNVLHFLILGLLQFIVLMIFSSVVFKVNWGYYLDTLLFAVVIILAVSGLGFMLATFVKTKAQQNIFGALIITLTSMLGGVYWPLSFVSDTMRTIANFIPQKWAMEGLLQLMSGGYRLIDVGESIGMLLLFFIGFYLIGLLRLRRI